MPETSANPKSFFSCLPFSELVTESELYARITAKIPGSRAHARKEISQLFDSNNFDYSQLSSYEAGVLDDSINQKYIPALAASYRTRVLAVGLGALAPYDLLLFLGVTLGASSSATTGAWYSITLKEMKEKFENMGLSLTSKLLGADMDANSLSTYAGVGLLYRMMAVPHIKTALEDPNPATISSALTMAGLSILTHIKLESILRRKEQASEQFDFNDATLAGMTEEQQKFFSLSISEVEGTLKKLDAETSGIGINRLIQRLVRSLGKLMRKFDVNEVHNDALTGLEHRLSKNEQNYSPHLQEFKGVFSSSIIEIMSMLTIDQEQRDLIIKKLSILNTDDAEAALKPVINDIVPIIMEFVGQHGEKGIATKPWAGSADMVTKESSKDS